MLAVLDRPCILFTRAVRAVVAYVTGWQLVGFVTACLIANAAGFLWSGSESGYLVDRLGSLTDVAVILPAPRQSSERTPRRSSQNHPRSKRYGGSVIKRMLVSVNRRTRGMSRGGNASVAIAAALVCDLRAVVGWALIDGPRPGRTLPSDLRRLSARLRRSAPIPAPAPVAG